MELFCENKWWFLAFNNVQLDSKCALTKDIILVFEKMLWYLRFQFGLTILVLRFSFSIWSFWFFIYLVSQKQTPVMKVSYIEINGLTLFVFVLMSRWKKITLKYLHLSFLFSHS